MNIELKEIDKDTLKVGDWVGVARKLLKKLKQFEINQIERWS